VNAAKGLRVDVTHRTDDDVGLGFGFHGQTLRASARDPKSGERRVNTGWPDVLPSGPAGTRTAQMSGFDNRIGEPAEDRYHRTS
jgi:hypothetical protein